MTSIQEVAIDHPVQPGWLAAGQELPSDVHLEVLTERFKDTDVDIEQLAGMLRLATARSDAYRMTFEAMTRGELASSGHEMATYYNSAGRASKVATFIHWFGSVAETCFENKDASKLDKIGLEIGGKRQAGDWECTGPLDTMVRGIPEQFARLGCAAELTVHNKGKIAARQYNFLPLYEYGATGKSLEYAIIRRKRGIADIAAADRSPIELFKKSEALVVISQLSERDQELIYGSIDDTTGMAPHSKRNRVAEGVAGRAFERAITEDRGITKDIVPVSAHYVMLARRIGASAVSTVE